MDMNAKITVAEAVLAGADPNLLVTANKLKSYLEEILQELSDNNTLSPEKMSQLPVEFSQILDSLSEEDRETFDDGLWRMAGLAHLPSV